MSAFAAAIFFLIGAAAVGLSLTAELKTGEHIAVLAVCAFVLMGVVGIWRCVDILEETQRKD